MKLIENVRLHYDGTPYTEKKESPHAQGPRGDYYDYILLLDGRVIALGDEQGNYSGGIYSSALGNRDAFINRLRHPDNKYVAELTKGLQPVPKDFMQDQIIVPIEDLAWLFPWINGGRKTYAALPECTQKDLIEIDEKLNAAATICQRFDNGLAMWLKNVRREAIESFKLGIVEDPRKNG